MTRLRAFAQREPLITRTALVYAAGGVAWAAARWFGVDLDQDVLIAVAASVLGLSVAVAREGVTPNAAVAKLHAPPAATSRVDADHTHTDPGALTLDATPGEPLDAGHA